MVRAPKYIIRYVFGVR